MPFQPVNTYRLASGQWLGFAETPTPDPGPDPEIPAPANTTTVWGSSVPQIGGETKAAAITRVATAFGSGYDVLRLFESLGVEPRFPPNGLTTAQLGGRSVVVSWRVAAQTVIAGTWDAPFRQACTDAVAYLDANPTARVYWSFFHEVEPRIAAGEFTFAQFRQAFTRLIEIQQAEFPHPRLRSTLILMKYSLEPASGRSFLNYFPPKVDVIGFDGYAFTANTSVASIIDPIVTVANEVGKPWAIAETGVNKVVHSGTALTSKLTALANYIGTRSTQPEFVTYFDDPGDATNQWQLSNDAALVTAWKSGIPSAPTPPPPPPSGTFTFESSAIEGGGFQNVIAVSPHLNGSARPYLIGADVAGVHRSTDRGAHWTPAAGGSLGVSAAVAAIMWSDETPGKAFVAEDSGIHMSTDWGATWTRRSAAAATDWDANNDTKVAGDPEHPRQTGYLLAQDNSTATKHVWAATETQGLRRSTDNFATFASTVMVGMKISSIALDPSNRDVMYASVRGRTNTDNGIWRISNARGAMTATRLTNYPGGTTWPIAPVELVAVNNGGTTQVIVAGHASGMFRYTPSTNTWATINAGLPTGVPVFRSVAADPTNPNILYCGAWHPAQRQAIWRSGNGGNSWTQISAPGANVVVDWNMFGTSNRSFLADISYHSFAGPSADWIAASLAIDPDVTNRVLAAGRGGAWWGTMVGDVRTWQPAVHGLMVTVNMAVAVDDLVPGRAAIGNMDYRLIATADAGETAVQAPVSAAPSGHTTGDSVAFDMGLPADSAGPSRLYVGTSVRGQNTGSGGVFSSANPEAGQASTWTAESTGAFDGDVTGLAVGRSAGGSRVILASVSNSAGGSNGGLWRKNGATWSQFRDPAAVPGGLAGTAAASNMVVLRFRRDSPVCFALDDDGVWRSDNAGGTWVRILTGVSAVYGTYDALAIDPVDATKVYVSSGGTVRRINNADTAGAGAATTTTLWAGNAGNVALNPDGSEMFINVRDGRIMRSTLFRTAGSQAAATWADVATQLARKMSGNSRSMAVTRGGVILTAENGSGSLRGVRV